MISERLCFAAVAVIRDSETNTISAFSILEGLKAVTLPFIMPSLSFFALWEREQTDPVRTVGTFSASINEELLVESRLDVDFGPNLRARTIANLSGLVVPTSGQLRFRFALEGGARAEYVVDVAAPPPVVQAPVAERRG